MKTIEFSTETESESKNYFEKYLQFIEKLRLESKQEVMIGELNLLEKIIIAFEAALKEKSELITDKTNRDYLNEKADELIKNWYEVFVFSGESKENVLAYVYNFFAILKAVLILNVGYFDDNIKYLIKLNPKKELRGDSTEFESINIIDEKNSTIAEISKTLLEIKQKYSRMKRISKSVVFDDLVDNLKVLNNNLKRNAFNINLGSLEKLEIGELIELMNKQANVKDFEHLFLIQDGVEYFEWKIDFHWSNQKEYKASKLSYLIWSFSNAFESIEDVEVVIEDWGSGSKWAKLKVKIKSQAAKVDALFFLQKLRQLGQSTYAKKSMEDLQKTEAEKNKIITETDILKKEFERKEQLANLTEDMILYEKALDIEKKEADIEKQKLDNLEKKLSILEKASKLAMDGFVQQDNDFHAHINECLFLANKSEVLEIPKINNLPEIEAKEEKKGLDKDQIK